ncbi:cob(I)yrinic acid a,c-diamide adenosyltransferase [Anaerolineae bacterium CFX9]|nr:cob(I)yrinic acid a,c-diamide adenosyltransferase [Kamptonema cortianum]MDL1901038.1 cob(I)yrinic acid a,c-diamide adenosyltransferase [Anaerolineae bacterium CFX9]
MKIYTRTGDDGTTSLFSGGRVKKHHLRVESYGTVDELNSALGVARAFKPAPPVDSLIERVQRQLFTLGADLATPSDARSSHIVRINEPMISWLEETIDSMDGDLPALTAFILPGGTPAAAHIHVARTLCRRAERLVVILSEHETINSHVLPYLNRLSDFLFTLARWENWHAGVHEQPWSKDDLL